MNMSESIVNISKALLGFQDKVKGIKKDAQGHGYKYITLDQILTLVRPALTSQGLVLIQDAGGDVVGDSVNVTTVQTLLIHAESGEFIQSDKLTIKPTGSSGKGGVILPVTPQNLGSAVTYAKRYQITAMLGLNADVDDDAAAVSQNLEAWGQKANKASLTTITNIMKEKGLSKEQLSTVMIEAIGEQKASGELNQDEANLIIAKLKSFSK